MRQPADGRTPLDHLDSLSLSRLNGTEADLMSRRSTGETGEVEDMMEGEIGSGVDGLIENLSCSLMSSLMKVGNSQRAMKKSRRKTR